MRRRVSILTIVALIAAALATTPLGAQTRGDTGDRGPRLGGVVSDEFALRHPDEEIQVFIQLDEPSVAEFAAATDAGRPAQRAQALAVRAQQREVLSEIGDLIVEERSRMVVGANGIRAVVRAGDIPAIRATEGVKSVAAVTRYHLLNETSVPWIRSRATSTEDDSLGLTGEGTTIAIIDTGIDYTHLSMGGSGEPDDYAANDPNELVDGDGLPNEKVIGGYDFAGAHYDASDPDLDTPEPDDDPLDVHGHGTHVAATAAGLGTDETAPGVAPDAKLYALKVFGDVAGSTDLVADAIEWALDPNGDGAIDDAVDVINMSLGADYGHPDDPSSIAAQNAADNGVIVVAAAGNAGPIPYVTGSPAVADGVISVAASLDGGADVMAMTIDSPESIAGEYEAAGSEFGPLDPPTSGEVALAGPDSEACVPIETDVAGKIALVDRGTCEFTVKVRHAQNAGAIGVLVVNNVDEPPITMAHNGTDPWPEIPAMMVRLGTGELIRDAIGSGATVAVTLRGDLTTPLEHLADTMADFSSQGPGFGNAFKPDVSAPGFNIRSADVGTGTGTTLSSGTSMATPHVAGAAALLREWNPDLTPEAAKALLMNAATPASDAAGVVPISRQGTGMAQVDRIVDHLSAYATPAGVVMRVNPAEPTSQTATIEVTGLAGADAVTYEVSIEDHQGLEGVEWTASSATVAPGDSVDVTLSVDPAALEPDDGFLSQTEADAWLVLTNPEDPEDRLRVGLVAVVDPASTAVAEGGVAEVTLTNGGPAPGFADGFTALGAGDGSLAHVGFRTADENGEYRVIDFGVALDQPWSSPSETEIDIYIDVDQDGLDDYAVVAADLGWLTGSPDPTGELVTALFDLNLGGGYLLYYAVADMNDRVVVLPADLTGDFGFLAEGDTAFDITVVVFDQLGLSGISDVITVDLGEEIAAGEVLSYSLESGETVSVPADGAGEMLWLFRNNPVDSQHAVVAISAAEPPADGEDEPEPPSDDEEVPPEDEEEVEPPSFDDVGEDHLFHGEIVWLAQQGITRGCNPPANTEFCPDAPVTRGQMAAFLHRALDLPETDENFFIDDENVVFEDEINRLAAAGITRGCNPPTNDEFCPDDELTRAQMAAFLVRAFRITGGEGSDLFVDDDGNIHEWAIDILGTSGVTRGCNPPANDMFCPDQPISRGQMAAFIYRAYHLDD